MSTPFKMKGFSGFGNSPLKQNVPMAPGAAAGAKAAKASKRKTTKPIEHTVPVPYFKDPKKKKIDLENISFENLLKPYHKK